MEKWEEFENKIPKSKYYSTKICNSDEEGLVVTLYDCKNVIDIMFGRVISVNTIEEGMNQDYLYSDEITNVLKKVNFDNVICKVFDGVYCDFVKKIANGMWEAVNAEHYVIITQNFNIDIISEFEPEIVIQSLE